MFSPAVFPLRVMSELMATVDVESDPNVNNEFAAEVNVELTVTVSAEMVRFPLSSAEFTSDALTLTFEVATSTLFAIVHPEP